MMNFLRIADKQTSAKENQFAMYIGRWQPLHEGHKYIFNESLEMGRKVCIAIRDIEPDEKNPFHPIAVKESIEKEYAEEIAKGLVKVIIIPDICSVNFGRGVGYDIIEHEVPQNISEISATKIREKLKMEGKL